MFPSHGCNTYVMYPDTQHVVGATLIALIIIVTFVAVLVVFKGMQGVREQAAIPAKRQVIWECSSRGRGEGQLWGRLRKFTRNICTSGTYGALANTESGWMRSSPERCERHLASLVVQARSSPVCVSVCFMQIWARVDVNCTRLRDTGAGGEQREGQAPLEKQPGRRVLSLRLWALKWALGLQGLVYKMGLRSLHLPWLWGWTRVPFEVPCGSKILGQWEGKVSPNIEG